MRRLYLIGLVLLYTILSMPAEARDTARKQRVLNDFSATLDTAEKLYLEGLMETDRTAALTIMRAGCADVRKKSEEVRRRIRVKTRDKVDSKLLWDWDVARNMQDWTNDGLRKTAVHPFRAEIKDPVNGDLSLLARRCIALQLQMPMPEAGEIAGAALRQFGVLQENRAVAAGFSSPKAAVSGAEEWRDRVLSMFFAFWALQRSATLYEGFPDKSPAPIQFAQIQADDLILMSSCAFFVPKDSPISKTFNRKLEVLTGIMELMMEQAGYFRVSSRYEPAEKALEKMIQIWQRWRGETGYLFYLPQVPEQDTQNMVQKILDEQLPITAEYGKQVRKMLQQHEKKSRDKLFFRKQQGKKTAVEPPFVLPPPRSAVPRDAFARAIREYNLELFISGGCRHGEARDVERLKEDMALFMESAMVLRRGISDFDRTFPEGLDAMKRRSDKRRYLIRK